MALRPYTITKYTGPTIPEVYQTAIGRWLEQQKKAERMMGKAEEPISEAVGMFRPGGGYGAGQEAIIQEEARKAKAAALANLVATGMSSGTAVSGLQARIGAETTKARLGVEDIRMENLTRMLSQLSSLRAGYAGQMGQTYDPYSGTMMGALASVSPRPTIQPQVTSATPSPEPTQKFDIPTFKF